MNSVKTKIIFLCLMHEIQIIVWCLKMTQYLVIGRSITSMIVANNHAHFKSTLVKTLRHPIISSFNQSACIFISGTDFIVFEVFCLIPTIIKETIPLYNSPFGNLKLTSRIFFTLSQIHLVKYESYIT